MEEALPEKHCNGLAGLQGFSPKQQHARSHKRDKLKQVEHATERR